MIGITIRAPAKVNPRLIVLARDTTGFHSLETLFLGISIFDTIELIPGGQGLRFAAEGSIDTGPAETNLAVRAATSFYDAIGHRPALEIRLRKRIPSAAGLGGGSSDAAATLRALNRLHDSPLDAAELLRLGATIGSDVPFFLTPTPFAIAWNRGDRLVSLRPPTRRPVLVADPGLPMPTAAAFRQLDRSRPHESAGPGAWASVAESLRSWDAIEAVARNDFDVVASQRVPRFAEAIESLKAEGARIALLAGSGACIFSIFDSEDRLPAATARMRELGYSTQSATTLTRWPAPRVRD